MIKELLNTAESKMQKTISVLTSDLTDDTKLLFFKHEQRR